jgi:hypothetical protein
MKNGLHIDKLGTKRWILNGQRHREDGPAVEYADGSRCWYLNGLLHREDGPAEEWAGGSMCWYLNGEFLGEGASGFWACWEQLTYTQRCNLNLHFWLVKYT